MSASIGARRTATPWRRAGAAGTAAFVAICLLGIIIVSASRAHSQSPAQVTSQPSVDRRLIIRPHTAGVGGALSGGLRLSGTLSPMIPGVNTLRVVVRDAAGRPMQGGHIRLVATMPGMTMPPSGATLSAHGDGYSGAIRLPMFGSYRVRVTAFVDGSRRNGIIPVALTLPRW